MRVLKEITKDWTVDFLPNHTYLINDKDRLIAYRKDDGTVKTLSGSYSLDRRRRKFKELAYSASEWGFELPEQDSNLIEVTGSKGDTYHVDLENRSCDCAGYRFRGNCKHIDLAQEIVDTQSA